MGCISQKAIHHPTEVVMFPKGVLEVEVGHAVLLRDTSLVLKMDPYLVLKIGSQVLKSLVHKNEGTTPVFNQKFVFYINSDKIPFGRSIEISVWDHNVGIDRKIGYGIIDIDTILLNRMSNFPIKCHISHQMKSAGWVKATLNYKEQYKGKLLIKPKQAILKRKLAIGNMNCAVKIVVGEDISVSKTSPDLKDNPPNWKQTLYLNLLTSLSTGRLSIININSSSEEEIGYVDLNLNQLMTKELGEHQLELKYKDTYAGTIKIESMFMSPQQFSQHPMSLVEEQRGDPEPRPLPQANVSITHQSLMIQSGLSKQ